MISSSSSSAATSSSTGSPSQRAVAQPQLPSPPARTSRDLADPVAHHPPTATDSSPSSAPAPPAMFSPTGAPGALAVLSPRSRDESDDDGPLPSAREDRDGDTNSSSPSAPVTSGTRPHAERPSTRLDPYHSDGSTSVPPAARAKRHRSRSPSSSECASGAEESQVPLSQPPSQQSVPYRWKRPLKRPRIFVNDRDRVRNPASVKALSSLCAMPVDERVAERYITALHALEPPYCSRPPTPECMDKLAHDLVINSSELRRVFALAVIARIAERKPCEIERLPFRHILAGYRKARTAQKGSQRNRKVSAASNGRRRTMHRLKGVSIRDARDTLAAAAWMPLARSQQVFNLLNGDEIIPRMRDDGVYVDVMDLVPLDEEDARLEEEAMRWKADEFLHALEELSATESIPIKELQAMARKMEKFAANLKRAPPLCRTEHVLDFVQKSICFEHEKGKPSIRTERDGPSQLAYRMTLYRTESLKLQASHSPTFHVSEGKAKVQTEPLEAILKRGNIRVHPFVERLLLSSFSSVADVVGDGPQFVHFGELLGPHRRARFLRAYDDAQVEALVSLMKIPDRPMAERLVANFSSAKRSIRSSPAELEWLYRDKKEAKRVLQHLHGYQTEYIDFLESDLRLPNLVGRVLHDELGDVENARTASFSQIVAPHRRAEMHDSSWSSAIALTFDERLAAYRALHAERKGHDETSWARCEASWGLFQVICERTKVNDTVGVTMRLLNEQKEGAEVLEWLATESTEDVCLKGSINADEAVRLKSFAYSFVPSACD